MLEGVKLPANLWGEAVLTACYLWNWSTSCALPPSMTLYEMVNNCKPNLEHIRVFGSYCFACIPTELQVKLGPHSHTAIFLGYPEGTKGYYLYDISSGAFFVACDIIFDERMSSHEDSSDSDDRPNNTLAPTTTSSAPTLISPTQVATSPALLQIEAPPALPIVWWSTCIKVPTLAGQA